MNITNNKSDHQVKKGANREHGNAVKSAEIPLAPEDQAPIEQDMTDADAFSSVASQREKFEDPSQTDNPDADPQINDWEDNEKEPRGVPASDPESGA